MLQSEIYIMQINKYLPNISCYFSQMIKLRGLSHTKTWIKYEKQSWFWILLHPSDIFD